jgi:hypothetical protein
VEDRRAFAAVPAGDTSKVRRGLRLLTWPVVIFSSPIGEDWVDGVRATEQLSKAARDQ